MSLVLPIICIVIGILLIRFRQKRIYDRTNAYGVQEMKGSFDNAFWTQLVEAIAVLFGSVLTLVGLIWAFIAIAWNHAH